MSITEKSIDDNDATVSTVVSLLFGACVALVLLNGLSVLPTNSSMIICSIGMIPIRPSSFLYKILILAFALGLPIVIIIFTNIKLLCFVKTFY